MKLKSIKINNYKSIGESNNILKFEDEVTGIIGKNESGKSNTLEAISYITFNSEINKSLFQKKNRNSNNDVSIELILSPDEKEKMIYKALNDTLIKITSSNIVIEGGISLLMDSNKELTNHFTYLNDLIIKNSNLFSLSDRDIFQKNLNILSKYRTSIIYTFKSNCDSMKRIISSLEPNLRDRITQSIYFIKNYLNNIYSILPTIYFRGKDRFLENSYSYETIKNALNEKNNIIANFLKAGQISEKDIHDIFDPNVNSARKIDIRAKIQSNVKKNIEDKFNDFYKQEKIGITIDITATIFRIYITSNNTTMEFSERSNGLKWYLSLFIDMLANNLNENIVVYLIDEPGVFLHVDAQKELLSFFGNLCTYNNQVIYTTHSPYMIDENNIINLRAIQKKSGITRIFNNVYDSKIDKISKKETLSPLLNALGTSLKYNIGPNISKKNIIVEGITDYMYLKSMLVYFNIKNDKMPYILPSVGASNICSLSSVLLGWGYDFYVIADYDREGYNTLKKLQDEFNLVVNKNIFYINCKEFENSISKEDYQTIESLIAVEDIKKTGVQYIQNDASSKKLLSKKFFDKINQNELTLSEYTINNFNKLFKNMGIIS